MTPDRFQQMAKEVGETMGGGYSSVYGVTLLRRYHAHIVRLVTRIEESERYGDSYHDACAQLRAALAAYKRGKP